MDPKKCTKCYETHKDDQEFCENRNLKREREQALQNPVQVDPPAEEASPPKFFRPWADVEADEAGPSFQGSQAAANLPEQSDQEALNQGQGEEREAHQSPPAEYRGQPGFHASYDAVPFIPNPGEEMDIGFLQNWILQSYFRDAAQHQATLPRSPLVLHRHPIKGLVPPTQYFSPNQGAVGSMNFQQMAAQQSPLLGLRYHPAQLPSTSSSQVSRNVAANAANIEGESNRPEKIYQCPYCRDKRYKYIHKLRDHIADVHSHLKFCNVYPCGREFDTDEKLRDHKRKDHTQDEIKELTTPDEMTFCPFCENLLKYQGIGGHFNFCPKRPKGQDVLICELHTGNMYFGSEEKKRQHDDKVHKNHYGFISSLTG